MSRALTISRTINIVLLSLLLGLSFWHLKLTARLLSYEYTARVHKHLQTGDLAVQVHTPRGSIIFPFDAVCQPEARL